MYMTLDNKEIKVEKKTVTGEISLKNYNFIWLDLVSDIYIQWSTYELWWNNFDFEFHEVNLKVNNRWKISKFNKP